MLGFAFSAVLNTHMVVTRCRLEVLWNYAFADVSGPMGSISHTDL